MRIDYLKAQRSIATRCKTWPEMIYVLSQGLRFIRRIVTPSKVLKNS